MKKLIFSAVIALTFGYFNADAQGTGCVKVGNKWVNSLGQDCINTIITAVPMLRIAPDARSGAMGDAGIAISPDPNAMHYNPSKLAFAEQDMGISATYTPWLRSLGLNDVYLAYLSAYRRIDKLQAAGIGVRYFSLGSIAFTDDNGSPIGNGRPNEFEVAGAYSRQLSPDLSIGGGMKFIYSNLAAGQQIGSVEITPGTAFAMDLSMTYKKPIKFSNKDANLSVGVALSNIGTKISYSKSINKDFIPANFGLGAALDINLNDFNRLTFTTDFNKLMVPTPQLNDPNNPDPNYDANKDGTPDYKQQSSIKGILSSFGDAPGGFSEELKEISYSIGMEYWYDKQFALRAGYFTENRTKGNRRYLTVGMGLKYNIFGLNFSYLVPTTNQRNPLDNTLRFTLLFDFGAFENEN